ncbi:ECF transporter S component [bacterium]|nr:ECF transporter S component [bacterium]
MKPSSQPGTRNPKPGTLIITRIGVLLGLTLAFQSLGLPQPVTGTFVNCVLFLSAALFGPWTAVAVGCLTPFPALLLGQLPPPLWPFLPVIAAGNILLVLVFHAFRRLRFIPKKPAGRLADAIAVFPAACVKFAWLAAAVTWWMPLLLGRAVPVQAAAALASPQLFTAMAGGAAAVLILPTMLQVLHIR